MEQETRFGHVIARPTALRGELPRPRPSGASPETVCRDPRGRTRPHPFERPAAALRIALLLAAAVGCGDRGEAGGRTGSGLGDDTVRPVLAVSVLPQAWLVERIAGPLAEVEVMIPPGASPTTFSPSLDDMRRLSRASLYFEVGHPAFPFEQAWLKRLLSESPDVVRIEVARSTPSQGEDPHVWLSIDAMRAAARALHAALCDRLPTRRDTLDARLRATLSEIEALEADVAAALEPARGRHFWVFHPAWSHLAEPFGVTQKAIESNRKEPDAARLARLLGEARADGVAVIFVQPQFSDASARVVAGAIGAELEPLDPLDRDWAANLRHAARRIGQAAVE